MIYNLLFSRLSSFLKGADIAIGGKTDIDDLFIEPTVLVNVKPNDEVMDDEIFGTILPIINIENEREAIEFINSR